MSIQLQNISKHFGNQKAVDDINLDLKKGEIVGFLGPNGAGKTTTMKMITGYIPPSAGQIKVCDKIVSPNSIETRSLIGYLPEHNPLYLDMYVKEFLQFAAETQGLNKPKARIEEMIELTGLGIEQHKKISALSKGYRQRVGLAQAMIHDPEVLILDEPTTGLDPNQIQEIRALIKSVGKEKTVLLSTHIMQEVQAICDRVVIINHGKIVADEKTEAMKNANKRKIYLIELSDDVDLRLFRDALGEVKVNKTGTNKFRIESASDTDLREAIFAFALSQNCSLLGLEQEEESLEQIFQNLTS